MTSAQALGIEIVPELVERSRASAAKAGVADRAKFTEQDLFKTDLSVATVITMYLLQDVNLQLRPALLRLKPGTRIVSHDWDLGDWQPDRSRTVDAPDKPVGLDKRSRLMLWVVPARLQGAWCGSGAHAGTRLQLRQQYQVFDATLSVGTASLLLNGRIDGPRLQAAGGFDALSDGCASAGAQHRSHTGRAGGASSSALHRLSADARLSRCRADARGGRRRPSGRPRTAGRHAGTASPFRARRAPPASDCCARRRGYTAR